MAQPVVPDTELRARAERGWQFLATRYGTDWDDAIELDELVMETCDACILGQLDGARHGGERYSFSDHLAELVTASDVTQTPIVASEWAFGNDDLEWHFVLTHGFETEGAYRPLTDAWREVILDHRERRGAWDHGDAA